MDLTRGSRIALDTRETCQKYAKIESQSWNMVTVCNTVGRRECVFVCVY